jgi:tyrosine-protein kinase Etk/Wzc
MQNVQLMSAEADKRLIFLQTQLPALKADLEAAENLLNEYRLRNESVDLSLETKSILEQIVNIDAQLNELTFKEAELGRRYKITHPNFIALMQKRKTLQEQRERFVKKVQHLPETQQEILRLTRDVEVNQQIYVQLLNTVQELNIVRAGTVGNVRILDKAEVLGGPVKPKRKRIVIIAILLGFMLGVGVVWLRNALRRGIENPDELEKIGLPVYASVPLSAVQQKLDRQRKRSSSDSDETYHLLAAKASNDPAIEAIRSLRTSMHFAMLESEENILMVTGPAQNVGKSFITSNLAAVYAESGKRVLLIDADMRKGYMDELFHMKDMKGLSEYLSKQISRDEAVQQTVMPGLDFISCGTVPPNPSELLMQPEFQELIEWGADKYDLVVIDSPPILSVTDATLIGRHAGINMLVAKHEITTTKELLATIRRCKQSGVMVKGCILNGVVHRASGYYGYGHYTYKEYSYDKGSKKKKKQPRESS